MATSRDLLASILIGDADKWVADADENGTRIAATLYRAALVYMNVFSHDYHVVALKLENAELRCEKASKDK